MQRRVGAGGQHQAQLRRLMLKQLTERLQDPRVTDPVEIVQHQGHHARQSRQARTDELGLAGAEPIGRSDVTQRAAVRSGTTDRERTQHVRPERLQVVVRLVHRQPCRPTGCIPAARPGGHRQRLAVTGSGTDQRYRVRCPGCQPLPQPWAAHEPGQNCRGCCPQPELIARNSSRTDVAPGRRGRITVSTGPASILMLPKVSHELGPSTRS